MKQQKSNLKMVKFWLHALKCRLQLTKEPPTSEIFLRLLRQCDDADELRAVRQLITKEMDAVSVTQRLATQWNQQNFNFF